MDEEKLSGVSAVNSTLKFTLTREVYLYLSSTYGDRLYGNSNWVGKTIFLNTEATMFFCCDFGFLFYIRFEPELSEEFMEYLRKNYPEYLI